jgi:hypothetical protein
MIKTWIMIFIAMFMSVPRPLVTGQFSMDKIETQRLQVVKLRVQPEDRSSEVAAGIYVGKDNQNAYFITAFHPLRKQKSGNDPVETVGLQFYGRATVFTAKVLDHFDPDLDLAVVYVPASSLPTGITPMTRGNASSKFPVRIIGHPPAGDWALWPGGVLNENSAAGNSRFFSTTTDPSLTDGFSGGPVFDSRDNFVGMHTEGFRSFAKALKGALILDELKVWHVPTTNLVKHPPIEVQKIDLEIASRIKASNEQVEQLSRTNWLDGKVNTGSGNALAFAGQNLRGILYRLDHSADARQEFASNSLPSLLTLLINYVESEEQPQLQGVLSKYTELRDFCTGLPSYEEDNRRMTREQVTDALNKLRQMLKDMSLPRWSRLRQ